MRLNLFRNINEIIQVICLVLLIILLSSPINVIVSGKHIEFDTVEFQEKVTIPLNDIRAIDIQFQKGKALEIIYTVQVKDNLPIDIWFVNEDNYLLLSGGAQFLYYIDGTGQEASYAKKIVTLTKYGEYKLVMTNYYSNQTVEVDVVGEIRASKDATEDNTFELDTVLMYIVFIIIIILVVVILILSFKIRKNKLVENKELYKSSDRKDKKLKLKKAEGKDTEKTAVRKAKEKKSKGVKTKDYSKKAQGTSGLSVFCGYCGEAVDTPYCKHCGRKV